MLTILRWMFRLGCLVIMAGFYALLPTQFGPKPRPLVFALFMALSLCWCLVWLVFLLTFAPAPGKGGLPAFRAARERAATAPPPIAVSLPECPMCEGQLQDFKQECAVMPNGKRIHECKVNSRMSMQCLSDVR